MRIIFPFLFTLLFSLSLFCQENQNIILSHPQFTALDEEDLDSLSTLDVISLYQDVSASPVLIKQQIEVAPQLGNSFALFRDKYGDQVKKIEIPANQNNFRIPVLPPGIYWMEWLSSSKELLGIRKFRIQ